MDMAEYGHSVTKTSMFDHSQLSASKYDSANQITERNHNLLTSRAADANAMARILSIIISKLVAIDCSRIVSADIDCAKKPRGQLL